jgi:hypothetical protein
MFERDEDIALNALEKKMNKNMIIDYLLIEISFSGTGFWFSWLMCMKLLQAEKLIQVR